jgi:hypothetical protein
MSGVAQCAQELLDALAERHGGVDVLSPVELAVTAASADRGRERLESP